MQVYGSLNNRIMESSEQQAAGSAGRRASHPNPWDTTGDRWACECEQCKKTRKAWPETTRIWSPKK